MGGLPPAWEWKAANSLYRFDATVDEGAAGRSEVQEGQAGCSGRSGLATGTENRREMKRVKRRETLQQGEGGGRKPQGRAKGVPAGDTSGWAVRTGGHKAADAAGGGGWHGRGRALGFGER